MSIASTGRPAAPEAPGLIARTEVLPRLPAGRALRWRCLARSLAHCKQAHLVRLAPTAAHGSPRLAATGTARARPSISAVPPNRRTHAGAGTVRPVRSNEAPVRGGLRGAARRRRRSPRPPGQTAWPRPAPSTAPHAANLRRRAQPPRRSVITPLPGAAPAGTRPTSTVKRRTEFYQAASQLACSRPFLLFFTFPFNPNEQPHRKS